MPKTTVTREHGQERPGGRTEAVRLAAAQAVLDLLKEGRTQFSMGEVAERAGIHRSTLYRRWQQQDELIREALTLHASAITIPDTGDWALDLVELVQNLAKFLADPVELAIVRSMLNPDAGEFSHLISIYWTPLMERQAAPIRKAQVRGEVCAALDARMVISMIVSPLLMHALVKGAPIPTEFQQQLIDMITRMARP